MVFSYWELFAIDLIVLVLCVWLMVRYGRLKVLHPAALYYFFHAYTFTFRLFQFANGAPTLFETWGLNYLTVSHDEIQRAGLVAIATLITMTGVWIYLAHRPVGRLQVTPSRIFAFRPFSRRLMWMVVSFTLPIGLVALVLLRGPHTIRAVSPCSLGEWSNSSYLISLYQWFGISLVALLFYYGFDRSSSYRLIVYLVVGVVSFVARVMVIVPSLFVIFAYLRRYQLRWRRPCDHFGRMLRRCSCISSPERASGLSSAGRSCRCQGVINGS